MPIWIGLANYGASQAEDVQVFLTITAESKETLIHAIQAPWGFQHREGGAWRTDHSVAIPAEFTRALLFIEFSEGRTILASESAFPRELEAGRYYVGIDVVGSNFPAKRFFGGLRVGSGNADWQLPLSEAPYESDSMPHTLTSQVRDLE